MPGDKVLIVDDDSTIRSTLAEAVRSWSYRTFEASTIAETRTIVDRERPDAVLLDVKLPDGSGIDAIPELKRRQPEMVIIVITGFVRHSDAFEAGSQQAYGYLTKPIDQIEVRSMLSSALRNDSSVEKRSRAGDAKRGRPQKQTSSPLGRLIAKTMGLLRLNYQDVVAESEHLARLHKNPKMRIGKSTLGNVISGSIRQPGTTKLDSLRIILNLSQDDLDAAIGLQPARRFAEQLEMSRARTHEVPIDSVTRHRRVRIPVLRDDVNLEETHFFEGSVKSWDSVEVEYLTPFYPPHLSYVAVGEEDTNATPIAPPGSRLLVNKLLNKVHPPENVSFHERELFYVLTPNGLTCVYAELIPGEKIVLIPHPASGNLREEFERHEVTIIGQVVGVLYPPRRDT